MGPLFFRESIFFCVRWSFFFVFCSYLLSSCFFFLVSGCLTFQCSLVRDIALLPCFSCSVTFERPRTHQSSHPPIDPQALFPPPKRRSGYIQDKRLFPPSTPSTLPCMREQGFAVFFFEAPFLSFLLGNMMVVPGVLPLFFLNRHPTVFPLSLSHLNFHSCHSPLPTLSLKSTFFAHH